MSAIKMKKGLLILIFGLVSAWNYDFFPDACMGLEKTYSEAELKKICGSKMETPNGKKCLSTIMVEAPSSKEEEEIKKTLQEFSMCPINKKNCKGTCIVMHHVFGPLKNKNYIDKYRRTFLISAPFSRVLLANRIEQCNAENNNKVVVLQHNGKNYIDVEEVPDWESVSLYLAPSPPELKELFDKISNPNEKNFLIDEDLLKLINQNVIWCRWVEKQILLADNPLLGGDYEFTASKCRIKRRALDRYELSSLAPFLSRQIPNWVFHFSKSSSARKQLANVFESLQQRDEWFYYLSNCNGDPAYLNGIFCDWQQPCRLEYIRYKNWYYYMSDRFHPEMMKSMLRRFSKKRTSLSDYAGFGLMWRQNLQKFVQKVCLSLNIPNSFEGDLIEAIQKISDCNFKKYYDYKCGFLNGAVYCK